MFSMNVRMLCRIRQVFTMQCDLPRPRPRYGVACERVGNKGLQGATVVHAGDVALQSRGAPRGESAASRPVCRCQF